MDNRNWYRSYISSWGNEEPSQYVATFARTVPVQPGETRILDVGCGSGIIGLYCLMEKKAHSVTFADKEQLWLDITQGNVDIKIHEGRISRSQVRLLQAADFATLTHEAVVGHDLVAFNPPQLPYAYVDEKTRQEIDSDHIERSFRKGGSSGLEIVIKFLDWYASVPVPKPDAVILLSSFLGRKRIGEVFPHQASGFAKSPWNLRQRSGRFFGSRQKCSPDPRAK